LVGAPAVIIEEENPQAFDIATPVSPIPSRRSESSSEKSSGFDFETLRLRHAATKSKADALEAIAGAADAESNLHQWWQRQGQAR
jgi:hypothetical protein